MPHPKDNTKMTGDTHLPDTESEFSVEEANAQAVGGTGTQERAHSSNRGKQGAARRGGKKAGVLRDGDAPNSDSSDSSGGADEG
jgi:hypothetical protein